VSALDDLLQRLEELLDDLDRLEEPGRQRMLELLDGIDALHRMALTRLGNAVGRETLERLRGDPAVAWLLDAYAVGVDERAAADAALEEIRPYIHSHGGEVDVLGVERGIVQVRMSGACSGCTASAETLTHGIEEALREHFTGFVALEVEEDSAKPHAPPGPTLLQIEPLASR
jgi:Fe-S cluster biogenesis protein NfuA